MSEDRPESPQPGESETSPTNRTEGQGRAAWWARAVQAGGAIALVLLALGALLTRMGVIGIRTGVQLFPAAAVGLAVIVLVVAAIALVVLSVKGRHAERRPLAVGGALALVPIVVMGVQFNAATSVPPIHDISTDLIEPPQFDAIHDVRGAGANPLSYEEEERDALSRTQKSAYPEVQPIRTDMRPEAAFDHALETARDMGWEIVASDRDSGRIEATATTFWYGFKDDVVIRVRAMGAGSRVDLRSVSRVGESDLGTNAERIRTFIERFNTG